LRSLGELTLGHVTALKMIASKVLGEAPPPREAPVLRPAATPSPPVLRPAATPRRAPAPVLTQPPAAPTGDQTKPRGPGRPPGSKNKPKQTAEDGEMVQAYRTLPDGSKEPLFDEETGQPRMIRKAQPRRAQRPSGALPFPNDTQIAQVSQIQANEHASKLEQNPQVQKALKGLQNPV